MAARQLFCFAMQSRDGGLINVWSADYSAIPAAENSWRAPLQTGSGRPVYAARRSRQVAAREGRCAVALFRLRHSAAAATAILLSGVTADQLI